MAATRTHESVRELSRHDVEARRIAHRYLDSQITKDHALREVAELIQRSNIVQETVFYSLSRYDAEVTDKVRFRIISKVLDPSASLVDVTRFTECSFDGWLRSITATTTRFESLQSINSTQSRTVAVDVSVLQEILVQDHLPDDALRGSVESIDVDLAWMPYSHRALVAALRITQAFNLPSPYQPHDFTDRQWVVDQITQDVNLASRCVHTVLDIRTFGSGPRSRIDDRLLAIWDSYDIEALSVLAEMSPHMVRLIVIGLVAPLPKLTNDKMKSLRAKVRALGAGTPGWFHLTAELTAAFVAQTCQVVSERDNTSNATKRLAMERAARIARESWPAVCEQALQLAGDTFHHDADELHSALMNALVGVIESA